MNFNFTHFNLTLADPAGSGLVIKMIDKFNRFILNLTPTLSFYLLIALIKSYPSQQRVFDELNVHFINNRGIQHFRYKLSSETLSMSGPDSFLIVLSVNSNTRPWNWVTPN